MTDRPDPVHGAELPAGDRGQTAIDFSVGIGIFLLTVAFVFAFTPSIFDPFTESESQQLVLADRSADHLSSDVLVESPTNPGVLNTTCTVRFFNTIPGDMPGGCYYTGPEADTAGNLTDALGIDGPGLSVNVTITDGGTVRTISGTGVPLAAGDTPPSTADTAVARRIVLIGNEESRLTVRVW